MALLEDIKQVLRITESNALYDQEIQDLIEVAKSDLKQVGLLDIKEDDPLVKRAITVYVKANFGWDNPDAERLMQSYEMICSKLATSLDYAYYMVTIEAGKQTTVTFDGIERATDQSGIVVFHSRAKNHVKYAIDGKDAYVDVKEDMTITVGD